MDLATFRADFINSVNVQLAAEGGFTEHALMTVAAERLHDAGELGSFDACHFRSANSQIAIDGYSFDEADDSLRVFISVASMDEEPETLTKTDAERFFRRLVRFLELAATRRFEGSIDENHPARDLAETFYDRVRSISKIRAYLVTDRPLSGKVRDWPEGRIADIPIEFHIWDITRFQRAHEAVSGFDELIVDFTENGSSGIPCMSASTPGSPYAGYLCVMPADVLARIYDTYGSRLLEGNVRSFLTTKGKINQGIRKTLLETPEMFFAYNNGISAVASEVMVTDSPNGPLMTSARDLQIVNGGQTTASIANVLRVDKAQRLHETFVPMKLSVVAGEQATSMVSDISRFANSQNKVTDADFFANHPFHQRLEQISRRILAPPHAGAQYDTRWYYERARGQYLNEFAKLTPSQRKQMMLLIPKSQVITKLDLAKSELSWHCKPHNVSAGAQNFFTEFAKRVDAAWTTDPDAFHEEYYRNCVSRLIVFRSLESLVSQQSWYYGGYRAIIVTYSIAKLSNIIASMKRGSVDLRKIWKAQEIYAELGEQLLEISERVFESLSRLPDSQINLTQWAKRQSCWDQVRQLPISLSGDFIASLVEADASAEEARASRAMQVLDSGIDAQSAILSLGSEYWRAALAWAEARGNLSAPDRTALKAAAGFSTALPTDKQSKRLLQLKSIFEQTGFVIPVA